MDDLIKLVRTYRLASGLTERLRLAEQIFGLIMPDLRVFVFCHLSAQVAEDALQEVLKAVATGMSRFEGGTTKEFWAWCYRIARNKLNDQYRRQSSERMVSMSPDELWQVMEASAQDAPQHHDGDGRKYRQILDDFHFLGQGQVLALLL